MEIVALVLVAVSILAYYGVMEVLEKVSNMAKRRVTQLENNQIESIIREEAQRGLQQEDVKKALENNAYLEEVKAMLDN